ncbi:MAG TPA: hypothetical protein VG893_16365 [Terracidiphilus sp.]|nr:hypothetical protein [Terracidiphilus sp.]
MPKPSPLARLLASSAAGPLLAFAAVLVIYLQLFLPPFTPVEGNGLGDIYIYLAPAQQMLHRAALYKDAFEFVTPGMALLHLMLFHLFGLRLWIPGAESLFLAAAWVLLGTWMARRIVRPALVLLPPLLFLAAGMGLLADPTHHWYSALASMAAVAVLLPRRTAVRIAFAGALCGLAATFTQTRGAAVLLGFVVFLAWEFRVHRERIGALLRRIAVLVAACCGSFAVLNAWVIWRAGLGRYFWCTVVFLLRYGPMQANSNTWRALALFFPQIQPASLSFYHALAQWALLFLVAPLAIGAFFIVHARRKPSQGDCSRSMLLAIVGAFMMASIGTAPTPGRLAVSALPGFLLLAWLLDSSRPALHALSGALALLAIVSVLITVVRHRPVPVGILHTARGSLAFTDPASLAPTLWLQQHTHPGDVFFEPASTNHYFFLDLQNPTPLSGVTNNGITPPGQVADVVKALEYNPPRYIDWDPDDLDRNHGWENPADDHLAPLRAYLHSRYHRVQVFEDATEIWERNP